MKSVEEMVRDILSLAIKDGLVALAQAPAWAHNQDPDPQARTTGDLLACGNALADWAGQLILAEREECAIVAETLPGIRPDGSESPCESCTCPSCQRARRIAAAIRARSLLAAPDDGHR